MTTGNLNKFVREITNDDALIKICKTYRLVTLRDVSVFLKRTFLGRRLRFATTDPNDATTIKKAFEHLLEGESPDQV